MLFDLYKIQIKYILRADKDYVEKLIKVIADGISVSPEAYITGMTARQKHVIDTYVDSDQQEEMDEIRYDDNME